MARIRTIKPEFFTSEDIVKLTPLARLFYVSLWCESDREGRLEWKPGTFKLRYFPADSIEINDLAVELEAKGLIIVYEVDGKQWAEIPTFTEHQVINNREAQSKIPPLSSDACARVKVACTRVKAEGKEGREGRELKEPHTPQAGRVGKSATAISLKAYLDDCKVHSAKPIPETDSVFDYAAKVGISQDFLRLQWLEFKDRYGMDGAKRYKSWPSVFGKSVRGNWFRLWYIGNDDVYALTTVGQQAKRQHGEGA